jgi:anti-anti-sigma factor
MGQVPGAALRCSGEIDISTIDRFERALAACIAAAGPAVTIDLREVEYLDSAAIEALLDARVQLAFQGRRLSVRAEPAAARLFRLIGVDAILNVRSGD